MCILRLTRCDWQVHCDWVGLHWELLPGASVALNPTNCLFDPILSDLVYIQRKMLLDMVCQKILTSCRQSIIHGEPCVIWNLFEKYFLCLYFHMCNKCFFFTHMKKKCFQIALRSLYPVFRVYIKDSSQSKVTHASVNSTLDSWPRFMATWVF